MSARCLGIEFPRGWVVVLIMMSTLLWFAGSFYERLWGFKCGAFSMPDLDTSKSLRNAINQSAGQFQHGSDVLGFSSDASATGAVGVSGSFDSNICNSSISDMASFCFQGQCWLPRAADAKEFPNFFLGIGPGRSGSTKIMAELKEHPSVFIGDAKLGHQKCCYEELYVLSEHERFLQGQSVYVDFFPPETRGIAIRRTHWFGEKTPIYSTNRLVPFRALAMFGPGLKLFLTWREPAEIVVSRYLQLSRKGKMDNQTFAQWAKANIESCREFTNCRQGHLTRLGLTERMIYSGSSFPVPATASVEQYLDDVCGQEDKGPLAALEGLGMFRRWAHVFGKQQILCILLEDQSSRMDWILDRMAKHLGIDISGFTSKRLVRLHNHTSPNASFDKLRKHQLQFGTEVADASWNIISEIRAIARENLSTEDERLFSDLCQ